MKTLLMAETSNLSYSKDGSEPIFRDLDKDLGNQDAWMHLLKPRSAMLKFCIPYHGGKQYSYLQGKLHLEVKLLCMCVCVCVCVCVCMCVCVCLHWFFELAFL